MFQPNTLNQAVIDVKSPLPRIPAAENLRRLGRAIPFPKTFPEFLRWSLALAFLTLGISLYIWTSVLITQARMDVARLKAQHARLEQENAQILWQISQYTSLERVQAQAQERGYIPMAQRRYVTVNGALSEPVIPRPTAQAPQPGPALDGPKTSAWPEMANAAGEKLQGWSADASIWLVEQGGALWDALQAWWQPMGARLGQRWEGLNLPRLLEAEPTP